jgi:ribosome-associated translation inhibitor RaiA
MEIHVHAKNIKADETKIAGLVAGVLERYADRLTRVDVFLHDENGGKGGVDKRCVLEARPRGLDPVAAEDEAEQVHEAVAGAVGKLERMLEHRFGKLEDQR